MKIIFESDGTPEDLAKLLQTVQRMTHSPCPEAPVFATTGSVATTAMPNLVDIEVASGQTELAHLADNNNFKNNVVAPAARRKRRTSAPKPDPFELLKKGWVLRGPYPRKDGKPSEVVLVNPTSHWKEKEHYSLGIQMSQQVFEQLKVLAKQNEKDTPRRGGDRRSKHCAPEDKPDPFLTVKKDWLVKGPWKEGGKANPYLALHIFSPDKKQHYKYIVGKTKAGYQGLTDADVDKLRAIAAGPSAVEPSRQQDSSTAPPPATPEAARPSPPAEQKDTACQLCLSRGRPLGKCEKMGAAHCKICHDRSHGDMLYPFKPL